jgi:hypothetical protein
MSDRDVQREIEANERRAREQEDVGIEEDVLLEEEQRDSGLLSDLFDVDDEDDRTKEEEFSDNTRVNDSGT